MVISSPPQIRENPQRFKASSSSQKGEGDKDNLASRYQLWYELWEAQFLAHSDIDLHYDS
jgi:hypothetical protein